MEKGTQDMADENAFAAAQLAAALIQAGKLTEKARGNTVEDATRLYFDCLDALRAESKKRYPLDAPLAEARRAIHRTVPTSEPDHRLQRPSDSETAFVVSESSSPSAGRGCDFRGSSVAPFGERLCALHAS
jgi:hypothetical protein